MKICDTLLPEFDHEIGTTRKLLERVPEDKWDWTPHAKSMKLGRLACHVAELTHFATAITKSDSMDFAKGEYVMIDAANRQQLLDAFDKAAAGARAAIAGSSDENLAKPWSLLMDGKPLVTMPKAGVLRTVMMNHLIHHRGQLCIFATYGYASAFDLRPFGGRRQHGLGSCAGTVTRSNLGPRRCSFGETPARYLCCCFNLFYCLPTCSGSK